MPKFIVLTNITGPTYYLRSTVWTSARERATEYDSEDQARAAIGKAAKFNPKAARKATIFPVLE